MGYIRGFIHGAAVGTVVGLCVAPQTGAKTRRQLAAMAQAAESGYRSAEEMVKSITGRVREETERSTASAHARNGHR